MDILVFAWLELLIEGKISTGKEAVRLLDEADQLSAILAQSSITVTERLNRKRSINHQSR